jgi:hypothetical protein
MEFSGVTFVRLISHQPAVLFSQNKPAISNQPAVLFSQNKSAPAISHQPNEHAAHFAAVFYTTVIANEQKQYCSINVPSSV